MSDPALNNDSPGKDILGLLGVRLVAPLGGRQNRHWWVETGKQRLVLRRWYSSATDIDYELRLLTRIAALGWPVAPAISEPLESGGYFWSLFPFLPGDPNPLHGSPAEQRARGRLLAEFHADMASLHGFGQRGTWRRCEQILEDQTTEQMLKDNEQKHPEEIRVLLWHLERARGRIAGLSLHDRPGIIVHGDFTPWNLRFQDGRLCGILDFELAHADHRIGDFSLSWRGKYDEVIYGYDEVSPLEPEEWALLTPVWWSHLIEGACHALANGVDDNDWTMQKLLLRSPLMGADADPFR